MYLIRRVCDLKYLYVNYPEAAIATPIGCSELTY
jgi:hypothetical protein